MFCGNEKKTSTFSILSYLNIKRFMKFYAILIIIDFDLIFELLQPRIGNKSEYILSGFRCQIHFHCLNLAHFAKLFTCFSERPIPLVTHRQIHLMNVYGLVASIYNDGHGVSEREKTQSIWQMYGNTHEKAPKWIENVFEIVSSPLTKVFSLSLSLTEPQKQKHR